MSGCREVAGVLFKHECGAPVVAQCARCGKPICAEHCRPEGYAAVCVGCLRLAMRNPAGRSTLAYLRDDPYFFWYHTGSDWFDDPYGADDFALFDSGESDFGQGVETEWHGS
jgi:arylsulfatase A-like enzyme